ncbi:hypothetical protein KEJ24_05975 [Candidatus Bathyarchaeota archaeon]|nr:hypothetical protein [Candidatus Bathyarchaeota archaeon]
MVCLYGFAAFNFEKESEREKEKKNKSIHIKATVHCPQSLAAFLKVPRRALGRILIGQDVLWIVAI